VNWLAYYMPCHDHLLRWDYAPFALGEDKETDDAVYEFLSWFLVLS
jgi:hypothetical protein